MIWPVERIDLLGTTALPDTQSEGEPLALVTPAQAPPWLERLQPTAPIQALVPAMSDEARPVLITHYTAATPPSKAIDEIDRGFGVSVEAMTRQEFLTFATRVARGDVSPHNGHAHPATIFSIAADLRLPERELVTLYGQALTARSGRYVAFGKPDDRTMVDEAAKQLLKLDGIAGTRGLLAVLTKIHRLPRPTLAQSLYTGDLVDLLARELLLRVEHAAVAWLVHGQAVALQAVGTPRLNELVRRAKETLAKLA